MGLGGKRPQMSRQLELPFESRGEAPRVERSEEAPTAARETSAQERASLMERVVEPPEPSGRAEAGEEEQGQSRHRRDDGGGAAGLLAGELAAAARAAASRARTSRRLVKQQLIPKSGGGMRKLGIPTVLDRFIQQALLQVLQPMFDPSFSEHSHGFRPGRRAHDAVVEAQRYIQEGRRIVVDVDLEQFFDRVNHDVLMGRLAKRIGDGRVLGLIRRYLEAGIMANGVAMERYEGTPQGGPLSPLLANVLLDEVDKELEKRGHAFVRYADDCNVYVRSRRAGERVMELLRRLYAKLRLRVNESKSAVDLATRRKLLGYSFWVAPGRVVKRRVSAKALAALKDKVALNYPAHGRAQHRAGGRGAGRISGRVEAVFPSGRYPAGLRSTGRMDSPPSSSGSPQALETGQDHLSGAAAAGLSRDAAARVAANGRRWWHNSAMVINIAFPIRYFDELGLPRLAA